MSPVQFRQPDFVTRAQAIPGEMVVAEGVETPDQAGYLAWHGHASMQGYLFHRPMPLDTLLAHLGTAERDFS